MRWRRFGAAFLVVSAVVVIAGFVLIRSTIGSREAQTISQANAITVYEGLPHQYYEAALLAAEKKAKPTVELHGFPFYRETLSLKASDDAKLKSLLSDPWSYRAYSGEKKCGNFHPDFALAWTPAGQQHVLLICFGCYEYRLYGPEGETKYDIPYGIYKQLQRLLFSYEKNRPRPGPNVLGSPDEPEE